MSYIALYRKWRPLTFDDVVEQTSVVKILKNTVKSGRIGHAYLFCGTRGTGKTTLAKIFSRAINCIDAKDGNPCNECDICKGILNGSLMDIIEIDAASNTGVDNVREIIEEVAYVPVRAKYKVYIIDEVHMLSTGAFNALLKTLEEPPAHVVFILATTDPNKLPATILSRCQRYEFKRISLDNIVGRLRTICDANGVSAEKGALEYIAQAADGALRDALSILDQCLSMTEKFLAYDDVLGILGVINEEFTCNVADAIINKDIYNCLEYIGKMLAEGKEIGRFVSELILYFRNLLIVKVVKNPEILVFTAKETLERMKRQVEEISQDEIIFFIKELSELEKELKWASQKKITIEVGIIRLCTRVMSSGEAVRASESVQIGRPADLRIKKPAETPVNKSAGAAEKSPQEIKQTDKQQKAVSGRPLDEADLRDILAELKFRNQMMILSYLRGVKAVYYSDKQINLIFCGSGKDVKKQAMQKAENTQVITEVFNKVLQKNYVIKMYNDDELVNDTNDSDNPGDIMDRLKGLEEAGVSVELL